MQSLATQLIELSLHGSPQLLHSEDSLLRFVPFYELWRLIKSWLLIILAGQHAVPENWFHTNLFLEFAALTAHFGENIYIYICSNQSFPKIDICMYKYMSILEIWYRRVIWVEILHANNNNWYDCELGHLPVSIVGIPRSTEVTAPFPPRLWRPIAVYTRNIAGCDPHLLHCHLDVVLVLDSGEHSFDKVTPQLWCRLWQRLKNGLLSSMQKPTADTVLNLIPCHSTDNLTWYQSRM